MSYEYYLQAHIQGDDQEIQVEKILKIFEKYITKKDSDYIDLRFDDVDSCTIYMETTGPTISGLMVSRPCGDERLADCLYQVMQLGNFVFFEPDGKQPIVLNAETENNLPQDMMESLGTPAIAKDLADFIILYNNNR